MKWSSWRRAYLALGLAACGSPNSTSNSRTIVPPTGTVTPIGPTITPGPPTVAGPSETAGPSTHGQRFSHDQRPGRPQPHTSVTPTQGPPPIGNVQRKTDVVEHGSTANAPGPLLDSAELFQGDVLKIHDGGEGPLLGNQLTLQLFNDSQLRVVSSSPPGTPLDIQIALGDGVLPAN